MAEEAPRCYALRRLSPFTGTLQVVEVEEGRAFSADGIAWKVELLSREPVRLPPWGDIGPAARERRYFTYGVWDAGQGMRRAPVNAILGDQSGHPAVPRLTAALEGMPALPFALQDRLELWLLDHPGQRPLALLRSLVADAPPPVPRTALTWRALPADDESFRPPAELVPAGEKPPLAMEALVTRAAGGGERVGRWYRRTPEGAGQPVLTVGEARDDAAPLAGTAFPPLLLRGHWDGAADQGLAEAYLDWIAPMLLTLPGLDRAARKHFEQAAARRPELLYRYRKLLPEIVDRGLVESALVRAVIQRTA